ncbi:hypothetical protein BH09VER1_BH09VER1_28400 [soil metagenome]
MSVITKKGMLRTLTEMSVDFLKGKGELQETGLTILARYQGNIDDMINAEIAKLGIYVYVWPVRGKKVLKNVPGIYFSEWEWLAEIGEDPTTNQTGCSAEYVAEIIAGLMQDWDPMCYGVNPLYLPDDVITDTEDRDYNGYFVKLKSSGGVPHLR